MGMIFVSGYWCALNNLSANGIQFLNGQGHCVLGNYNGPSATSVKVSICYG